MKKGKTPYPAPKAYSWQRVWHAEKCHEKDCFVEPAEYDCGESSCEVDYCVDGGKVSPRKDVCGQVVSVRTLPLCPNTPGNVACGQVKVPVVLAEPTIQIEVEADLELDQYALEIKRIKKEVVLTQCELVLGSNKLFIGGYVRKNIEYATVDCEKCATKCGDIRHCTVHVPFECVTPITFANPPQFHAAKPCTNIEFEGHKFIAEESICVDVKNEKPFCELLSSVIYEEDIIKHKECGCDSGEELFKKFTEKMVIILTLKVLQKQQRVISLAPPPHHHHHCKNDY
ncbi:hypothetical protein GTO89_00450 [Heliobacterium gestii]|uniref:DUF7852 domain-containing protein n=1 Tax=Heliomicrobium gestii TaxID=2699 RepID=A0A845L4J6_HELGE|nr:hypothetical protein [Heliomicrobium gestii]MBM7865236.1 hypothetical protein [Heliomicrobium gestii]MZP41502.1 hypothetical protein [Heliomicrobium gestii]